MHILFIADLVGDDAVGLVVDLLPRMRHTFKVDFTIVNGENADRGKGMTDKQIQRLKGAGVDCLTSGNHIWDPRKRDLLIEHAGFLLRPHNYPEGNAGIGTATFRLDSGVRVGVLNLQGRSFMYDIDCPFRTADREVKRMRSETDVLFVDIHAEATAEKVAMGWHLDGRVSAVIGTHTHIQTADERILPKGTAYLTDAGMTGPENSVIGMETHRAIERFILQSHVFYSVAKGPVRLNGVLIEVDEKTGRALGIRRLNFNKAEFGDAF